MMGRMQPMARGSRGVRRLRSRCLVAVAPWLALWPAAAGAAQPRAPTDKASTVTAANKADVLVAQGLVAFRAERYDDARDAYVEAYALLPEAQTLLELAVAELKGGHPVEAADHFRQYLARHDVPADKVAAVRDDWMLEVEKNIAHLVITVPAGAEIVIDGAAPSSSAVATSDPGAPGKTVLSIDIRAGAHEVVAQKGAARQVRDVVAPGGQRLEIQFAALEQPAAPPVPTPATAPPKEERPPLHRSSQPAPKMVAVIALGAGAVVAGALATVFHITFEQNSSDIIRLSQALGPSGCAVTTPPADCATLHHARDAQRASAALADGFAVGAGALAVAAVATWFFWPSQDRPVSTGSMRLLPVLGAGQAGLLLARAW
jgi:tetratricopeptide (TPR) repeat protein